MQCPFIYADGHQCSGQVWQARAYGKRDGLGLVNEQNIIKIRLWCSEKNDHAGAVSSFETKERMEFYPDDLQRRGILAEAVDMCDNIPKSPRV
jgi:hypothetical protein